MEHIIELIKILLPAALVLWACYNTMSRFLQREQDANKVKTNKKVRTATLPLQLKAYERLILFLERIAPHNMIQRSQQPGMTCTELQLTLLKMIRQEYEHNMTQQLYVSDAVWDNIVLAKESINQTIITSTSSLAPEATALDLSQHIIQSYSGKEHSLSDQAITQLKAEVKDLFLS
jgi:hypothetical protein